MSRFKAGIVCLLTILPASVGAQTATIPEEAALSLQGKHRIEIVMGFLTELSVSNEVTAGGVTTQSAADGLVGCVAYTYYVSRDLGVHVSAGVLDADAKTSVIGIESRVEAATVVPLLFGVKYQPSQLAAGNALRPYASASVGPYFGSASNVRAGLTASTEAFTETALGSRLGIGMDVFFAKRLTLGVGAGYHFVSDFDRRIGSETNYSGPEFSLAFGVAFGG